MSKITFYIVRHGKTIMNTLDKVQGWCDSPLTPEGINVARYLGYGLRDISFRGVYCSDLLRTKQTAKIILDAKGQSNLPIIEHSGLREACFGSFEAGDNKCMWGSAALFLQYISPNDMYRDILARKQNYNAVLDVIKKLDTMGIAEGFAEVEARTQEALTKIAETESDKGDVDILVVSHGMSIIAMLHSLGGYNLINGMIDNASVSKVVFENGIFKVESMGDMTYVEKGRLIC